jgi:hypothetical protein
VEKPRETDNNTARTRGVVVISTGRGHSRYLKEIRSRGDEFEGVEGEEGGDEPKGEETSQRHRVFTRRRWLWVGPGPWMRLGVNEGRSDQEPKWFFWGGRGS